MRTPPGNPRPPRCPSLPADSMIRVGADYQAVIPDCKPGTEGSGRGWGGFGGVPPTSGDPPRAPPESPARYSNKELKGMLVWAPNHCVSDAKREPPAGSLRAGGVWGGPRPP